jgi:hypothetical protein
MQPRIRIGLIVGIIGLALNVCVAGFVGLCGPFLSLIAGGIAGFFAARQEKPLIKGDGVRAGATAGGIAGGLIIIGQIIGGVAALYLMQARGMDTIFGQVPGAASGAAAQATFYLSGVGTALCFGVVGALLAAIAGAGAGYLGTTDQPVSTPPADIIS